MFDLSISRLFVTLGMPQPTSLILVVDENKRLSSRLPNHNWGVFGWAKKPHLVEFGLDEGVLRTK